MPKAFLICPVRGADLDKSKQYVLDLEKAGWDVHWPPRDTDQNDDTGLRICQDNLRAIKLADVVFVYWDGKSQGCLFDLGLAFALDKPLVVINAPVITTGKSFQNMMREIEKIHLGQGE